MMRPNRFRLPGLRVGATLALAAALGVGLISATGELASAGQGNPTGCVSPPVHQPWTGGNRKPVGHHSEPVGRHSKPRPVGCASPPVGSHSKPVHEHPKPVRHHPKPVKYPPKPVKYPPRPVKYPPRPASHPPSRSATNRSRSATNQTVDAGLSWPWRRERLEWRGRPGDRVRAEGRPRGRPIVGLNLGWGPGGAARGSRSGKLPRRRWR